ncbi:sugar transferase [Micromonospora coxensis]|uniref:sugar transferase n=1 Tax=Micromonospora coxensis TaxID=356852 RepID=UPI00342F17CA
MSRGTELAVKRLVDVVVAAVAILLTAPVMAVAAAAVLVCMGRPVLFRQRRIGLDGREFAILKLRSMRAGRVDDPRQDGQRLTPLGRWLRASSIDELPSLFNVLRGEMSLVGPRPLPVSYRQRYTAEQFRRHLVRPGVTGLAQVNGRNALDWETRFAYDVWYVDNVSLLLDLRILARTVVSVVRRVGIAAPGAATAHEFTGEPALSTVGAAPAGPGSRSPLLTDRRSS